MKVEDKSVKAESLKEEGIRLFRFGEYEEAAAQFDEAHALYGELDNVKGQAEMLNNLGAIHTQEGRWDEAIEAFTQAKAVFESLEDKDGQAQTLGNLGTTYRHKDDKEAAVEHLKEAVSLFHDIGEREKEAATLTVLSRIRLGQGRWFEALHFYDLSLGCSEPPGLKERILRRFVQIPLNMLAPPQ
jgi:tetratricopeptide (TPR) repeat protein